MSCDWRFCPSLIYPHTHAHSSVYVTTSQNFFPHSLFVTTHSFAMSGKPINQPSSWTKSTPHTAFHRGRTFPDPSDRSACARFQLRQKASRTTSHASSSNPDISQLWHVTLDLSRRLTHLSETVLALAINSCDHLAHHLSLCTVPMSNVSVAPLVSV